MSDFAIPPLEITDTQSLISHAELLDIVTYELQGMRRSDSSYEDPDSMHVSCRQEEMRTEVRVRHRHVQDDADLLADIAAVYEFDMPVKVLPKVMTEFVERVAIMTIIPFLREAIMTTAVRMGVSVPVLAMVRQGTIKLTLGSLTEE